MFSFEDYKFIADGRQYDYNFMTGLTRGSCEVFNYFCRALTAVGN